MKRNGMCPLCYLKKLFCRVEKVSDIYTDEPYDTENCPTPPMGWSSWNTFKNKINRDLIYETAVAMKEKGLLAAGYKYVNLDDNWHSNIRTESGELQGDLVTFADGIPALVRDVNALGLKLGIYSSNGTHTCEDLPASLGREYTDAYTFAKWGIEYFKYDFCHNIPISKYAPIVYGVSIGKEGEGRETFYSCLDAKLYGLARIMDRKHVPGGKAVTGLDANQGAMEMTVKVEEAGEYVLTVNINKGLRRPKYLTIRVGGKDYGLEIPPQKHFNNTARYQLRVELAAGENVLRMFNPIKNRADSAMLQYRHMGQMLKKATKTFAEETQTKEKPIVFSICEWGLNSPWSWGRTAGNLWRTTPDIRPVWPWIKMIYARTVRLWECGGKGGYNDPDMLEVGNGKLTYDENMSHFALWCMMNAPLILGNDVRSIPDNVLEIVTNAKLIAINQDPLAKQAKRIKKGRIDVLAKPLSDGVALCFFNKGGEATTSFALDALVKDSYISLKKSAEYTAVDLIEGGAERASTLTPLIPKHGVRVFKIVP